MGGGGGEFSTSDCGVTVRCRHLRLLPALEKSSMVSRKECDGRIGGRKLISAAGNPGMVKGAPEGQ